MIKDKVDWLNYEILQTIHKNIFENIKMDKNSKTGIRGGKFKLITKKLNGLSTFHTQKRETPT